MNRSSPTRFAAATALALLTGCAIDLNIPQEAFVGDMPHQTHPELAPGIGGRSLPALNPIPAGLGVNIHFYEGNERDWKMLTDAGVGIVRMDVSWARCEKKPGVYDFSRHDALVERLAKNNIRLLFIIDYGNPLYDDGVAPHSEACRQAYARFVSALVSRYKGKGIIWELWNEPNIGFWKPKPNVNDYMAWCKAVVPAIRKADPNACIIAPATSGIPHAFMKRCFELGLLELVDGISVHPYRRNAPETALREYRRLARLIRRHTPPVKKDGRRKYYPILSGEWGYSTTWISDELQGKYLPRQWLANMAAGVPISIWYDWHDDGKDPNEKEHNFGTVTWDYKPKPAYVAMKTLIEQLRGYVIVHRIELPSDDDFAVVARKGDQFKLAIWTTGETHEIELGPDLEILSAVDHLGRPVEVSKGPNQTVTDAPRYLTVASPVPGWLGMLPMHVLATSWWTLLAAGDPRGETLTDWQKDITASVSMANTMNKDGRAVLGPVRSEGTELVGRWMFRNSTVTLGKDKYVSDIWSGDVPLHNRTSVPLTFSVDVAFAGETPHTVTKTVEVDVPHPITLDLAWRHDGLRVEIEKGGARSALGEDSRPLKGFVIPRVDGVDGESAFINLGTEPKTRTVVHWSDIRLVGVPRNVSVRVEDEHGHVVARTEPMTYALIDAARQPVGSSITSRYRLWHEGEKGRTVELAGAIARSPGEDPPFPRSIRIDYSFGAGWCFWLLGPNGDKPLPTDTPKRLWLWTRADVGGDAIRARVMDKTGQTHQPHAGTLEPDGWRLMEMSFEDHMGHWGGPNDGVVRPPLTWASYCLQDSTKVAHQGTTYVTGIVLGY